MQIKNDIELGLSILKESLLKMIEIGHHHDTMIGSDRDLFSFKNFNAELERNIESSTTIPRLKKLYNKCWSESNTCIELYDEQISKLPNLLVGEKIPTSSILDFPGHGNCYIVSVLGNKVLMIKDEIKYQNILLDDEFQKAFLRKDIYEYCIEIKALLEQHLFKTTLSRNHEKKIVITDQTLKDVWDNEKSYKEFFSKLLGNNGHPAFIKATDQENKYEWLNPNNNATKQKIGAMMGKTKKYIKDIDDPNLSLLVLNTFVNIESFSERNLRGKLGHNYDNLFVHLE